LAKEALDIREKQAPDKWETFRAQSSLGGILLDQKRWKEAEPLLVSGFNGMKLHQKEIPAERRTVLAKGAEWLVRLYQMKGEPEKAAAYQKELEAFESKKKTA
jgi:hypothetical protein